MNLEKLLAQNMLRFGTKNINESQLKKFLLEFYDWSNSGKKNWDNANVKDLIKYILEKDKGKAYTNIAVYTPIFNWFQSNARRKKESSVRSSLRLWAGDIYEGLSVTSSETGSAADEDKKKFDFSSYINTADAALKQLSGFQGVNKTAGNTSDPTKAAALKSYLNLLNAINKKISLDTTSMKMLTDLNTSLAKGSLASGALTVDRVKEITNNVYNSITDKKINTSKIQTEYITDDQRTELMSSALQQVMAKMDDPEFGTGLKLKAKTIPAYINACTDINIDTKGTSATIYASGSEKVVQGTTKTQPIYQSIKFQYPSVEGRDDNDRTNEAISYFADDKATPLPEVLNKINTDIATVNKQIKDLTATTGSFSSVKVLSIVTSAYSSTSWVNSGYQGKAQATGPNKNVINVKTDQPNPATGKNDLVTGQYKNPKTGQLTTVQIGLELPQAADKSTARNVPLAADRCKNLLSTLRQGLAQGTVGARLRSSGGTFLEQPAQEFPNNGPMWTKVGGKNLFTNENITIANYGPLFQAAYKIKNNLTPQNFYGLRNDAAATIASQLLGQTVTAADLTAEYEATYSKFRVSGCMFFVQVELIPADSNEFPADLEEKQFIVATSGNFEIALAWPTSAKRLISRLKDKIKDIDWKFDLSFLKVDTTSEGPLITTPGTFCPKF